LIDDLINEANEEKKNLIEKIKKVSFKIEEEVKEIGIPLVLQPFHPFCNLPKQLKLAEELWKDLQVLKEEINCKKETLLKSSIEMYKEEFESIDFGGEPLPLPIWIHELFNTKNVSFSEDSSFTTAAISHLDAAINQLDPFYPSLLDSLTRIEEAHEILSGRLEMFKVEYEAIWKELEAIFHKLYPFDIEEVRNIQKESELITTVMTDTTSTEGNNQLPHISRSGLRKVLGEWKRIEKERIESISGSILLIGRLWNLLETSELERFPLIPTNLSLENMKILSQERHRLINFQQQKFKELYDSQVVELEKLMAALRWSEARKKEILSNCQSYTVDGLQFLSCQLAALQPKLELTLQLITSITSRYAIIAKMREFEKSASDPARLFRSSFQLLQEEKFRKTALPNLLKLESQIKSQLSEYKFKFQEEFIYYPYPEDCDCVAVSQFYSELLEEEISSRFMSSGIFGFDQSKQRKERQSSIGNSAANSSLSNSVGSTPRYTTTSTATTRKSSSIGANVIPQRRKLDK
jgi:hypothetical protein